MHAVFAIDDCGVYVRIGMFCALSPLSVKYMVCACVRSRYHGGSAGAAFRDQQGGIQILKTCNHSSSCALSGSLLQVFSP